MKYTLFILLFYIKRMLVFKRMFYIPQMVKCVDM